MTRTIRVIEGDTGLPPAYDHPHASEAARRIAEQGTILRAQVGSGVHGTSIAGQDDRDEMGICLEPREYVTGVARVPAGLGRSRRQVPFEQYHRHTVWDRPGGLANRSGPGDLDVVIYSARKWARLALAGNPTVLLLLFVPDDEVVHRSAAGVELVENAHRFVSRAAAERFLGYLAAQRRSMLLGVGRHGDGSGRPSDETYDPKAAMHALRLGVQGIELLRTGRITLPIPEPDLGRLREVRRGEWPKSAVLSAIDAAEGTLRELATTGAVPAEPDREWVDAWLHRAHEAYWAAD